MKLTPAISALAASVVMVSAAPMPQAHRHNNVPAPSPAPLPAPLPAPTPNAGMNNNKRAPEPHHKHKGTAIAVVASTVAAVVKRNPEPHRKHNKVSSVAATAITATASAVVKRTIDLGSCSDASITFSTGLDGRAEASFQPANLSDFNHGSALNIGVITNFICSQLGSACKAPATSISVCQAGAATASSLIGQAAADAFNAAVGGSGVSATSIDTTVDPCEDASATVTATATLTDPCDDSTATVAARAMAEPCDEATVVAAAAATATADLCEDATATVAVRAVTKPYDDAIVVAAATTTDPCDDATATVAARTMTEPCDDTTIMAAAATTEPCANDTAVSAVPVAGSKNLDFGICTDPTMKFGGGFDGRPATENSFLPTNSDGNFGGQQSALNPNIIANFICDTFVNRCKAGTDAIAACTAAKAVVAALKVRDATVATEFNAALGF